jgi:hypothetical protein
MNRVELIRLLLKGLSVWLLISGLFWWLGDCLLQALLPLFEAVVSQLSREISPAIKLMPSLESVGDSTINLSAWVLSPIYLNEQQFIPPGTELTSSAHLLHALVPVVIELAIVMVWPVSAWSQRFLLIGLGFFTALLVILATIPTLLLGHLEVTFQEVAQTGNRPRLVPWFLDWMIFCELGGSWLLAILGAWLCIQIQRRLQVA